MRFSRTKKAVAARNRRYFGDAMSAKYGVQCARQAGARSAPEIVECLNYLRISRSNGNPWNTDAVLHLLRRLHDWGCDPSSLPAHEAHDNTGKGRETAGLRLAAILVRARAIYIAGIRANGAYALPDMTPEEIAIATAP